MSLRIRQAGNGATVAGKLGVCSPFLYLMKPLHRLNTKEKIDITPRSICSFLSLHVIGQEQAKRTLAIAAYNHLKRSALPKAQKGLFRKSNILLMGPTGSGKTHLAHQLAAFLQVPFFITDATEYTQAGYHGKDVETIFGELLFRAHHSVEETEKGIVFLDEVDKLARRGQMGSVNLAGRDIGGEGVQQSLLKVLEGKQIRVPLFQSGSSWQKQDSVQIDTTDILFVAAGTFSDLKAAQPSTKIGFAGVPEKGSFSSRPISQDLIDFGMMAEFVGRFPIVAQLDRLTERQLVDVLTIPSDALVKEYTQWLELDGVQLVFSEGALKQIAAFAYHQDTGARSLRSIMEHVCHDLMFEGPEQAGTSVVIDERYVLERLASKTG